MSQKRMFSKKITESDAFMDMPATSQLLYFHLNMNGDDDGFVGNPKVIMRTVGAKDDDLKLLISKRFVIFFDSGICVIKHWLIHNTLKNDRYIETVYTDEKKRLTIKKNKAYTDDSKMFPKCFQNVSKMEPQRNVTKHNITKRNKDIQALSVKKQTSEVTYLKDFETLWSLYPKKLGKVAAFKKYKKMRKDDDEVFDKIRTSIENYIKMIEKDKIEEQYIKHGSTFFNNWEDYYNLNSKKVKFDPKFL